MLTVTSRIVLVTNDRLHCSALLQAYSCTTDRGAQSNRTKQGSFGKGHIELYNVPIHYIGRRTHSRLPSPLPSNTMCLRSNESPTKHYLDPFSHFSTAQLHDRLTHDATGITGHGTHSMQPNYRIQCKAVHSDKQRNTTI